MVAEVVVRGILRFPGRVPAWATRVVAQVLDVGHPGAPAAVLGRTELVEVPVADGMVVEVRVPAGVGARVLSVEMDVSDADDEASGDYVTTEPSPLPAGDADCDVEVELTSV